MRVYLLLYSVYTAVSRQGGRGKTRHWTVTYVRIEDIGRVDHHQHRAGQPLEQPGTEVTSAAAESGAAMATAAPAPAMAVPLDQWARQKAPLSEAERASVGALADWLSPTSKSTASTSTAGAGARAAAAAVDRHAPNGSGKNADGAGRSSVAGEYQYGAVDEAEPGADNASRPTTSSSEVNDGAAGALMATLPSQPLTDAPSYLAWLGRQQARMLSSAQSRHLQGLHELSHAADEAQVLLDHLEAARVHIAELRAGAKSVEESSEDLRDEAETMVERIVSGWRKGPESIWHARIRC